MAIFQRLRDVFYAVFFLVHLTATVLADAQLLFQRSLFPPAVVDFLNTYIKDYKDPLVGNNPVWFRSLLYFEVIAMTPFLVVGVFGALLGARWMRTPSIIYSTAVISMVVPMVGHLLFDDFKGFKVGPSTQEERLTLLALYGGFALVALIILLDNVFFRAAPASGSGYQGKIGETGKHSQKKRN
ncbi:putative Transmembrane protein 97 [Hypsibius exemplaris]|uniref:Sigma intracellular receptor 2 n=1 Tax=Hypsibius exemplaris TaxID=2072580 RepID=A0A9X6N972_HYPEX|nr:putative Transmembrane protein 97 [Hypsibius exemplaris]